MSGELPKLPILRISYQARLARAVTLPRPARSNALRGELGNLLYRTERFAGVFERLFRAPGPARYVVRPPLDPGERFAALAFELRLLGPGVEEVEAVAAALEAMETLADVPVQAATVRVHPPAPLPPVASCAGEIEVKFLTPTHLLEDGQRAGAPTLPLLVKHASGRIADLARAAGMPWDENLGALRTLAELATSAAWEGEYVRAYRRSAATGMKHHLGGLIGAARFSQVAEDLLPVLRLGSEIHIGHGVAWGNGWYEVLCHPNG